MTERGHRMRSVMVYPKKSRQTQRVSSTPVVKRGKGRKIRSGNIRAQSHGEKTPLAWIGYVHCLRGCVGDERHLWFSEVVQGVGRGEESGETIYTALRMGLQH